MLEDMARLWKETDYYSVPNDCQRFRFTCAEPDEVPETGGDKDADYESENELQAGDV